MSDTKTRSIRCDSVLFDEFYEHLCVDCLVRVKCHQILKSFRTHNLVSTIPVHIVHINRPCLDVGEKIEKLHDHYIIDRTFFIGSISYFVQKEKMK